VRPTDLATRDEGLIMLPGTREWRPTDLATRDEGLIMLPGTRECGSA